MNPSSSLLPYSLRMYLEYDLNLLGLRVGILSAFMELSCDVCVCSCFRTFRQIWKCVCRYRDALDFNAKCYFFCRMASYVFDVLVAIS